MAFAWRPHDPAEIQLNGREVSDTKFKAMSLISADAGTHLGNSSGER